VTLLEGETSSISFVLEMGVIEERLPGEEAALAKIGIKRPLL